MSGHRHPLLCFLCLLCFVGLVPWQDPCDHVFSAEMEIARWSFNESRAGDPIVESVTKKLACSGHESAKRVPGPFGNALELEGPSAISVEGAFLPESLEQLTISAWIKPSKFERYNEIFRGEQGNERILFSLQENATVLSLGINVDGNYLECDAVIDPGELFDGQWHHAVGTFDGKTARVYLDARLVEKRDNPGKLRYSRKCRYFIGSSSGHGEFWQGAIDELALDRTAWDPDRIAREFRQGLVAVREQRKQFDAELEKLFPKSVSGFAETLCAVRRNVIGNERPLDDGLADAILSRLRADFPDEYHRFIRRAGMTVSEYIRTSDDSILVRKVETLLGPMSEFMPLTEMQWTRLTPEQHEDWQRLAHLLKRFREIAEKPGAGSDPVFVELLLEATERIVSRPVQERVAPYISPSTPEPKQLDQQAAREAIEQDWLFQTEERPIRDRTLREIAWARQLLDRLENRFPDALDFTEQRTALDELENTVTHSKSDDAMRETYFRVRSIKRKAMFANPLIDFQKILLVDMPFPAGSEWQHETRHRLGYMAIPGGQLLVLDGLDPGGKVRRLMPREPLHGSFWRPDLSFDGRKVLFCFKPHNEKAFHLYEIDLDGTGLRQITSGMFDDLDPVYLPDGKNILFTSTRGHTYVRCMPPTNAFVLTRCGLDGNNMYIISGNNEPDYLPSVLSDGRIVYTRWEYTDKPLWRIQSLWTVNPDGTQSNTFWGNQSVWPDLLKDARSIPNSRRVMFTGSAHHNWFAGSVGIVDPDQGLNFPHGLTKVTADVPWPESGNGPVDPVESPNYHSSGKFSAYFSPYPLGEEDFIVSANKNGKFVLYLMDVDGNRELIYEGAHNVFHAIPIRSRSVPPVIADRVDWPTESERFDPKPGYVYSSNVYQGVPEELVGKAKYLRVLHIEPKTYTLWNQRPYASTGPVVSMVQSEGVKRVLGTVPVRDDGSVSFEVPSGIALHFQLLDENHLALQTMRSFVNLMPGESRGCVGCHELEHHSAVELGPARGKAVQGEPSKITPVPWAFDPDFHVDPATCSTVREAVELARLKNDDIPEERRRFVRRNGTAISFTRDVQPVLDKNCGKCHQVDGEAKKTFDMTRRPGFLMFDEPYVTLIGAPNWGGPGIKPTGAWGGGKIQETDLLPGFGIAGTIPVEAYGQRDPKAYETFAPMTSLSYKSRLIEIATTGKHRNDKIDPHDVKLAPVDLLKLILWVDTMCPYISDEEIRAMPDPTFQGVDWLSIRPRLKTAPIVVRPGPFRADGNDVLSSESSPPFSPDDAP